MYQIKAFIQSPTTSFTLNTNTSDYNPLLKLSDKSVKSLCSLHQNKITISQLHTVHLKISNKMMDSSIKNICSFNLHSVTHPSSSTSSRLYSRRLGSDPGSVGSAGFLSWPVVWRGRVGGTVCSLRSDRHPCAPSERFRVFCGGQRCA